MKSNRRTCLSAIVISFSIVFVSAITTLAGSDKQLSVGTQKRWVSIFPVGMAIQSIVFKPGDTNSIYASTYKGLLKSVDGGKIWLPLKLFDQGQEAKWSTLKLDPADSQTLYWGINWDGNKGNLWRSKDGGKTWKDITSGVIKGSVHGIAVKPGAPEIIYVAAKDGLYKTINSGKTWGKLADEAYNVFINPEQPNEMYAIYKRLNYNYGRVGLYHSVNEGQSFNYIEPQYTTTEKTRTGVKNTGHKCEQVGYATLNPNNSKDLLVYCDLGGSWKSFIRSSDSGQTWQLMTIKEDHLDARNLKAWAFHPMDKDAVYIALEGQYAGVKKVEFLKSTDGGDIWSHLAFPPVMNIADIRISSDNVIYLTSALGVYKTADEGNKWEPLNLGLPSHVGDKKLLAVDNDGKIHIGENNGYWTSNNQGISWDWSSRKNVNDLVVNADGTRFVISNYVDSWRRPFLHIDKIGADQSVSEIKVNGFPNFFAVAPSNPQNLYVIASAAEHESVRVFKHLLKSEDGGFSWSEIDWLKWLRMSQKERYVHELLSLTVDAHSPDKLFAIIKHIELDWNSAKPPRNISLLKTSDGGKTWADISQATPLNVKSATALSLHADPSNSSNIYLVMQTGLYRSSDAGKTWKAISPRDKKSLTFNNLAVDTEDSKYMYLSSSNGVYKSVDHGNTWRSLNDGLFDAAIGRIVISQHSVFAAGANGIYMLQK